MNRSRGRLAEPPAIGDSVERLPSGLMSKPQRLAGQVLRVRRPGLHRTRCANLGRSAGLRSPHFRTGRAAMQQFGKTLTMLIGLRVV